MRLQTLSIPRRKALFCPLGAHVNLSAGFFELFCSVLEMDLQRGRDIVNSSAAAGTPIPESGHSAAHFACPVRHWFKAYAVLMDPTCGILGSNLNI
jgi:hypothetical protein